MNYSFLDQFDIIRIIPCQFGNLDISITNSTLFLGLATFYIVFMCQTNVENGLIIPGGESTTITNLLRKNQSLMDGINKLSKYKPI